MGGERTHESLPYEGADAAAGRRHESARRVEEVRVRIRHPLPAAHPAIGALAVPGTHAVGCGEVGHRLGSVVEALEAHKRENGAGASIDGGAVWVCRARLGTETVRRRTSTARTALRFATLGLLLRDMRVWRAASGAHIGGT